MNLWFLPSRKIDLDEDEDKSTSKKRFFFVFFPLCFPFLTNGNFLIRNSNNDFMWQRHHWMNIFKFISVKFVCLSIVSILYSLLTNVLLSHAVFIVNTLHAWLMPLLLTLNKIFILLWRLNCLMWTNVIHCSCFSCWLWTCFYRLF